MTDKKFVVVSRKWNSPQIEVAVSTEGIAISIPLTDFLKAVVQEIGNPTFLVTQVQLLAKLQVASDLVCTELKSTTKQVM